LKKDQFIFQQGQKHEFVYFPESAVISKFHILEDGRTIEVEVTGREGALGVTSLFNSPNAINCAQVCIPGTAYKVESEIVLAESRSSQILNQYLCEQICRQLTNLSQKVICNTFHHVEQRLSTWLLLLDEKCKSDYLTMTQEHIARVLGVHRPSVTYIAQDLRNKKLIDYVRGRIYIRDRKGLEKLACVCYSEMHSDA
jgi:CRP-like cAMP-binding protein